MGLQSGIEAQPQSKDQSIANEQKWVRSCDVGNGCFTLTNPISGKFLTAKDEASVTVEGKLSRKILYLLFSAN